MPRTMRSPSSAPSQETPPRQSATLPPPLIVKAEDDGGAAVFERGGAYWLVFPGGRLDTPAALPPGGTVQNTGDTLTIRLPLGNSGAPNILRTQAGWRIGGTGNAPALAVAPQIDVPSGRLNIPAVGASRVVVVADPETGGNLLVGTLRNAASGISLRRDFAQFSVLPSARGVVVLALSDNVSMRVGGNGFVIGPAMPGDNRLALSPEAEVPDEIAEATRVMDLPHGELDGLLAQLKNHLAEAASVPPLARGSSRLNTARTLLSLGLGVEAQAVMRLLASEDPHLAQTQEARLMSSVAAVLADRVEDADDLTKPGLGTSDEVALWQSLRALRLGQKPADVATALQAGAPVILAYPDNLRRRLAPVVVEALIDAGQQPLAHKLLSNMRNMPELGLARAMEMEATGDIAGAMAAYDALVLGRDRLNSVRAWRRLVELRLTSREIGPREAADQLEMRLAAWRGDAIERDIRERIAELRSQAGNFPAAIAMLREAIDAFPDDAAMLRGKLTAVMTAMAADGQADRIPPMVFVSTMERNADALPSGEAGTRLANILADKLIALDLPARAAAVLDQIMQGSTDSVERARLGVRLAEIQIHEGDGAAALAALAKSVPPAGVSLPEELQQTRALASAKAELARGNRERALVLLAELGGDAADSLRATTLAQMGNWKEAGEVLAGLAARTIPASGTLDENARRLLLRQAVAAAMAGDSATLQQLRDQNGSRFADGPLSDIFHVLTAKDINSLADLPRLAREIELARAAPDALGGLLQRP